MRKLFAAAAGKVPRCRIQYLFSVSQSSSDKVWLYLHLKIPIQVWKSNPWYVVCLPHPPELSSCVSSQQCPPDWRDINSRCYFLSTEQKTWEDSRKYCQSKGADLVVINSEEEQVQFTKLCPGLQYVCTLVAEKMFWSQSYIFCDLNQQRALYRMDGNQDLLFWIGLHDTTGTFKWVDGSALTKT